VPNQFRGGVTPDCCCEACERLGSAARDACWGRRAGAEAETSASRQRQPSALPARCSRLTRRADTRSLGPRRDSRNNPCRRQAVVCRC
jgi:hypothetical protein